MEERECYKCKSIKAKSEFYKRDWLSKFKPNCKSCIKNSFYRQDVPTDIYIYRMYNNQKSNARGRNMPIPDY